MRLCKDCKHWEPSTSSTAATNFDKCDREKPPTGEISMVTGIPVEPKRMFAEDERKHGGCGPEAIFFEPRAQKPDNTGGSENAPF